MGLILPATLRSLEIGIINGCSVKLTLFKKFLFKYSFKNLTPFSKNSWLCSLLKYPSYIQLARSCFAIFFSLKFLSAACILIPKLRLAVGCVGIFKIYLNL